MFRMLALAAVMAVTAGMNYVAADDVPGQSATQVAHRASTVIGMTVKNAAGKDLGTVNDIVLDMGTGHVRYYALSYGGWLGLGDKLFAVPHKTFQVRRFADSDKHYLVLNVSEEKLKNAPGFDQNNWPDFANDAQWREKVDRYYGSDTVTKPVPPKK
jgi:sporulation protein YlmC with PRC-barrel domain